MSREDSKVPEDEVDETETTAVFISNELDWYKYENRIRKEVVELIDPERRRGLEDRENIVALKKSVDQLGKKLEELDFILMKTQKRTTVFDELSKRISESEGERKIGEANFAAEIDRLEDIISSLKTDIVAKDEQVTTLQKQIELTNTTLKNLSETLSDHKEQLNKQIDENLIQMTDKYFNLKSSIEAVDEKAVQALAKHPVYDQTLNQLTAANEISRRHILELQESTKTIKDAKLDEERFVNFELKLNKELSHIRYTLEDNKAHQKKMEHFLVRALPIIVQNQISQTLHAVLGRKERTKLDRFEEDQIQVDRDEVLRETDIREYKPGEMLQERVEEAIKRRQELADKNSSLRKEMRAVAKASVPTYLRQDGSTFLVGFGTSDAPKLNDNITALGGDVTVEHSTSLHYARSVRHRQSDDQSSSDDDAGKKSFRKVQRKLSKERTYDRDGDDEDQADASGEESGLIDSDVEELLEVERKKILKFHEENMQSKFDQQFGKLKVDLFEKSDTMEEGLKKFKEENRSYVEHLQIELEEITKKRKRDRADQQTHLVDIAKELEEARTHLETNQSAVTNVAQVVACLLETIQIDVCLDYQDEEDRKGISLMGYKENAKFDKPMAGIAGNIQPKKPDGLPRVTTPRNIRSSTPTGKATQGYTTTTGFKTQKQEREYSSTVNLDRNCLSCSGSPSVIFSAFKMACLAYTPSMLSYRGETYNRQQLVEIRSKMIQGCWDRMKKKDPWPTVMQGIVSESDEPFLPMIHLTRSMDGENQSQGATTGTAAIPGAMKHDRHIKAIGIEKSATVNEDVKLPRNDQNHRLNRLEPSKSENIIKLNVDFMQDGQPTRAGATGPKTSRLGKHKFQG